MIFRNASWAALFAAAQSAWNCEVSRTFSASWGASCCNPPAAGPASGASRGGRACSNSCSTSTLANSSFDMYVASRLRISSFCSSFSLVLTQLSVLRAWRLTQIAKTARKVTREPTATRAIDTRGWPEAGCSASDPGACGPRTSVSEVASGSVPSVPAALRTWDVRLRGRVALGRHLKKAKRGRGRRHHPHRVNLAGSRLRPAAAAISPRSHDVRAGGVCSNRVPTKRSPTEARRSSASAEEEATATRRHARSGRARPACTRPHPRPRATTVGAAGFRDGPGRRAGEAGGAARLRRPHPRAVRRRARAAAGRMSGERR